MRPVGSHGIGGCDGPQSDGMLVGCLLAVAAGQWGVCFPVAVGAYRGIAAVLHHLGLHQYAGNVYHLRRLGADLLRVFGDYGTAMRACPGLVVLGAGEKQKARM